MPATEVATVPNSELCPESNTMHYFVEHFPIILLKSIAILVVVGMSMVLVVFANVARGGTLQGRKAIDVVWPILPSCLVCVGYVVMQFVPHPPNWVKIVFICVEYLIVGVLLRKLVQTLKQKSPEDTAFLREMFLSRIEPRKLVLASALVIIASVVIGGIVGYLHQG